MSADILFYADAELLAGHDLDTRALAADLGRISGEHMVITTNSSLLQGSQARVVEGVTSLRSLSPDAALMSWLPVFSEL